MNCFIKIILFYSIRKFKNTCVLLAYIGSNLDIYDINFSEYL